MSPCFLIKLNNEVNVFPSLIPPNADSLISNEANKDSKPDNLVKIKLLADFLSS